MKDTLPVVAAAVFIALFVGAAGMYVLMPQQAPAGNSLDNTPQQPVSLDGSSLDQPEVKGKDPDKSSNTGEIERLLADKRTEAEKLAKENNDQRLQIEALGKDKQALEDERVKLAARITELETLAAELADIASGPNHMRVNFGKWSEIEGLRKAEWTKLGQTYSEMNALLKEYAQASREGKEPDPELQSKMTKLNKNLQDHLVSFFGKLPSNTGPNGEFTHPINMVNILAGQLEAAGLPLTEQQIADLVKLGEEYERRWEALNKDYTDQTWDLQKFLDECELKEWFHDEMFKVTDAKQKAAALPPEVEGIISMDLYSSGLSLMFVTAPVRVNDASELKAALKLQVTQRTGIQPAALDGAEYIFDDWLTAIQPLLGPVTEAESELRRSRDAIHAGKAELVALRALFENVAPDDDTRKRVRAVSAILLPQVLKQE